MDATTITLIIGTLLTLVQSFMTATGINNTVVNQVIAGLTALEPYIVKLGPTAWQSIQNIIATVKAGAGASLTTAQLDALDSISDQVDAAWDSAWADFAASKKKLTVSPSATAQTPVSEIPTQTV